MALENAVLCTCWADLVKESRPCHGRELVWLDVYGMSRQFLQEPLLIFEFPFYDLLQVLRVALLHRSSDPWWFATTQRFR